MYVQPCTILEVRVCGFFILVVIKLYYIPRGDNFQLDWYSISITVIDLDQVRYYSTYYPFMTPKKNVIFLMFKIIHE